MKNAVLLPLILFLIWVSVPATVHAQQFHISGRVTDVKSGNGIGNVNISILGTNDGCTSNEKGDFTLISDRLPVNLMISHLNYKTRRIWVEEEIRQLEIAMDPMVQQLREVEVTSGKKPLPFYSDPKFSIIDYEIYDDLVFLLVHKFRRAKAELICKTVFGDTVARSAEFGFRPLSVFIDCLGSLHVLSEDSAYQVFLVRDSLLIGYVYDRRKFLSTLGNCVTSTGDRLFFREESRDHLTVRFYALDRENSERVDLVATTDVAMRKVLYQNPADYYYLLMDTIPGDYSAMIDWLWIRKILYQPNTSVLTRLGDTLALFNTTDGSLQMFRTNGRPVGSLSLAMDHVSDGNWTKEIFVDQYFHQPYTSFERNGVVQIFRVDLEKGLLQQVIKTTHAYPEKIRIQHGRLFYLYDDPGERDNRRLYIQPVKN